jgi:hypothetical protein
MEVLSIIWMALSRPALMASISRSHSPASRHRTTRLQHVARGPWRSGQMTIAAAGKGVASQMCAHSVEHARTQGYRAMQFNFVVSTNGRAIRLLQRAGFETVGKPSGSVPPSEGRLC